MANCAISPSSCPNCSVSTTVMMLSIDSASRNCGYFSVRAILPGLDTPLASIRMYSGRFCRSPSRRPSCSIRSLSTVQQMQPLARLRVVWVWLTISSLSMLIAPKSLTITAMRKP